MFKCEKCKKTTAPGDKVYQYEIGNGTRKRLITTYGKEIVKEISVCEKCYAEVQKDVCV